VDGSESQQGVSIALSSDGNTALVGGQGDNASKGAAWVFMTLCAHGDVNGDGVSNVSDAFYYVNYLFAGGPAPMCY
jgi:hypothetical protein